jgi:hypothetical protein
LLAKEHHQADLTKGQIDFVLQGRCNRTPHCSTSSPPAGKCNVGQMAEHLVRLLLFWDWSRTADIALVACSSLNGDTVCVITLSQRSRTPWAQDHRTLSLGRVLCLEAPPLDTAHPNPSCLCAPFAAQGEEKFQCQDANASHNGTIISMQVLQTLPRNSPESKVQASASIAPVGALRTLASCTICPPIPELG